MTFLFTWFIAFSSPMSRDYTSRIQYHLKLISFLQLWQLLINKITITKESILELIFLKIRTVIHKDQEDLLLHLVTVVKEATTTQLTVFNTDCVRNIVTPWSSVTTDSLPTNNKPNNNNNVHMQAMFASSTLENNEAWFFNTGATHHLNQDVNTLSDVQPYQGTDQVTIGNGKKISILYSDSKILPSTFKNFHL